MALISFLNIHQNFMLRKHRKSIMNNLCIFTKRSYEHVCLNVQRNLNDSCFKSHQFLSHLLSFHCDGYQYVEYFLFEVVKDELR